MGGPAWEFDALLTAAARGDSSAMAMLLDAVQPTLLQFVARRLDRRVAARIDPADVVQDVLLFASTHLVEYLERSSLSFSVWLQKTALQQIAYARRIHIRAKRRSVCRETHQSLTNEKSCPSMIEELADPREMPPPAMAEAEDEHALLKESIAHLPVLEQELLHLRFVEDRSAKLIAKELGITEEAVRMRQVRALRHLRALLVLESSQR
jgi:RNA polymerase sigma-70 factor (ECF subfamily)